MVDLAATRKNTGGAKTEQNEQKFSKEQILASARYANRRDLVDALLDKDKSYTFETVDNMIEKYKKGQVK
ncbi:hypothetical protein LK537_19845 [Lachnoclostridium pacaense]|nr:hypothetical protein [Lachnoclostridium pacaense]MCC2819561.1 hypothetical protein [Lachnoclostridium pacaense]DAL71126.1 MAG TPA: hypothetical protein [Caudoviricetes sp.]